MEKTIVTAKKFAGRPELVIKLKRGYEIHVYESSDGEGIILDKFRNKDEECVDSMTIWYQDLSD
jgi:hypothetical protein